MKVKVIVAFDFHVVGAIIDPPSNWAGELIRRGWVQKVEQAAPPEPINDSRKAAKPARARRNSNQ